MEANLLMQKFCKKTGLHLQKHSATILSVISSAGVIGTAVLAIKATPKANRLIEESEVKKKGDKLDKRELVMIVVPAYLPTIVTGALTICCIFGANVLNKKQQAAITSAYAMLNDSYKHYRDAAKTVYGEDADSKIQAQVAQDARIYTDDWGYQTYNMDMDPDSERVLCYDMFSNRYFNTTMAAIINAQYHINRNLQLRGYSTLNEFYSFLGIDDVENGDKMGWDLQEIYEGGEMWLDFNNQKTVMDDGMECIIISGFEPNKFGIELLEELYG